MNYAAQQAPLQGMANQMAQYGRYGDSMLVHMNPAEVQGIASLSPTGQLTTNPVTGQPEAFLPFLAPILGSMLGSSLLTGAGAGILGTTFGGLSSAAAGAIGSGLATTAVTGDIKEGILSGLTGYGLGQMLGGAAKATDPAIDATEEALKKASESVATTGADLATSQAGLEALSTAAQQPLSGVDPVAGIAEAGQKAADAQAAFQAAKGTESALQSRLAGLEGNITGMDRFTAPFRQPGALLKGVTDPRAILPIAVGEGTRGQMQMQEALDAQRRRLMGKGQEEEGRALFNMQDALAQRERDYGPMRLAAGGITSINPENYRQNLEGLQRLAGQPVQMQSGGTAGRRQASIRPPTAVAPPEGYRPGFDPEFMYFQDAPPPPPSEGGAPAPSPGTGGTGGAPVGGGSALTPEIIDRYTNLATTQGNFHRQSDLSGRNIQNRDRYLSDFMSMRAMYPELIGLDDTLDIDPAYRQGGSESFADIGGNTFGDVEGRAAAQPAPAQTVGTLGGPGYGEYPLGTAGPRVTGGQIRPGSRSSQPDAEALGRPAQARMGGRGGMMPMEVNDIPAMAASMGTPGGGIADAGAAVAAAPARPAGIVAGGPPPVMDTPADVMRDAMQPAEGRDGLMFRGPGMEDIGGVRQQRSGRDVPPPPPPPPPRADAPPFIRGGEDFMMPPIGDLPAAGGIADLAPAPAPAPAPSRVESNEEIMQRLADLGRRGAFTGLGSGVGRIGMQEGGKAEVEIDIEMEDTMEANGARLIEQTAAAIAGNMPEEQAETIINRFIDEYGSEAFEMLRNRVLRDIVPNAQTEGRIEGQGGGMDDMIPGMIGTQQPVAVSPGEYIVPADVVSGLGDGDTNAGAGELDGMLDRVRQARTGRRMQPQPLNKNEVMPA